MSSRPGDEVVLSLRQVSRRYGRTEVLSRLTLNVSAGQIVGLVGPNGADKTTLLSIMGCELAPSAGDVAVLG
ncbi:MAG: ATP-binding cassette domain-containing protein [Bifidobacteriaceae bacterium]|jgi:ABC-type multidrug transport system ATPase subunit|nr:ATP-binding cassette domain-containing protein [Bifidobacteriaceae bacterium]